MCFITVVGCAWSADWSPSRVAGFFTGTPGSNEFLISANHLKARLHPGGQLISVGSASIGVSFLGASEKAKIEGLDQQPGVTNFLIGSDPTRWQRDLNMYAQVVYRGLYPGIDLVCHTANGQLKSDFVLAPGADPAKIRFQYTGADTALDAGGNIVVTVHNVSLIQNKASITQDIDGQPHRIRGQYRSIGPNTFGFSLGPYRRDRPLIIDPVLSASTYIGGTDVDALTAVTTDLNGNIYVAGWSLSTNLLQSARSALPRGSGVDAFVAKLDPTGTQLQYFTYLGGSGDDRASGIAVDSSGNVYLAGSTTSADFPLANSVQLRLTGAHNAFVTKLNPSGNGFVFSTYFGGSGQDYANGAALGASGFYIAGSTTSTDLPGTTSGAQAANHGQQDAFAAKFSTSGALIYATYAGGSGNDSAQAIAVDSSGNAYLAGSTGSTNFPKVNPYQAALRGSQDAFILKLSADGKTFLYSTYLGGTGDTIGFMEAANAIAVDSSSNMYVAGVTPSTDFPVTNAAQSTLAGAPDGFVVKLNPAGSQMLYGTFLGGVLQDYATAIAVDSFQNAYVGGYTGSPNFPTLLPIQASNGGLLDAFVAKFDPNGKLLYSTYLGGSGSDSANAISISTGHVYVAGQTSSADFPVVSPLQASNAGMIDGFLSVITEPACTYTLAAASTFLGVGPSSGTVGVTTSANCNWTASSNASWLSVTSGAAGIGNGTVSYTATANSASSQRSATLNIGGQTFTVTQSASVSKVGIFRAGYLWILDVVGNGLLAVPPDQIFAYGGLPGDIPIAGDWNGDGNSKVGIYRASAGVFMLDWNGDGQFTSADKVYNLNVGIVAGDVPVVGDWNGDGRTKVGLFRQGYFWILDYNGNGVFDSGDKAFAFGGAPHDIPVVGDWNGDGKSKVGLFRGGFFWVLDINGNGQFDPGVDPAFPFGGAPGDVPVVGDWNGDGTSKVGLFRAGYFWVLDANGNHLFDGAGPGQDLAFPFGGAPGDIPVVGKW